MPGKPKGLVVPGTIFDLFNRPETAPPAGPYGMQQGTVSLPGAPGIGPLPPFQAQQYGEPLGAISTTFSKSFNDGPGREVLLPTVISGKFMTDDEALARYRKTGQHLGVFDTPENADAYATQLHNDQWRFAQMSKLAKALIGKAK